MFKRKIYDSLLDWKKTSGGKTALLVEGPRRVGKSTVIEKYNYKPNSKNLHKWMDINLGFSNIDNAYN